jgi:RecJ-like exonuclease
MTAITTAGENFRLTETCPRCGGEGTIEAGFWPCPDCKGSGEIESDDECYCDFASREFFGCFDRSHAAPCPQAREKK